VSDAATLMISGRPSLEARLTSCRAQSPPAALFPEYVSNIYAIEFMDFCPSSESAIYGYGQAEHGQFAMNIMHLGCGLAIL
jgi:hypothetical protein